MAAVFAISTTRTVDETIDGLREAATRHHFTVLSVLNMKEKLNSKGFAFVPELRVVELCNSDVAAKALSIELGVSVALPCRISVYEESGRTKLSTMLPSAVSSMFPQLDLKTIMASVETTLKHIMQEAVL